jgi:hypothetical protein
MHDRRCSAGELSSQRKTIYSASRTRNCEENCQNKVQNQLSLLQEIREKSDSFKENILRIKELLSKIEEVESDDSLRGLE